MAVGSLERIHPLTGFAAGGRHAPFTQAIPVGGSRFNLNMRPVVLVYLLQTAEPDLIFVRQISYELMSYSCPPVWTVKYQGRIFMTIWLGHKKDIIAAIHNNQLKCGRQASYTLLRMECWLISST